MGDEEVGKRKPVLGLSLLLVVVLSLTGCLGGGKTSGDKVTLTVAITGEGSLVPKVGKHEYSKDTVVDLKAEPAENWQFSHWSGDVAETNAAETSIKMDGDKSVRAVFVEAVDVSTALSSLTAEFVAAMEAKDAEAVLELFASDFEFGAFVEKDLFDELIDNQMVPELLDFIEDADSKEDFLYGIEMFPGLAELASELWDAYAAEGADHPEVQRLARECSLYVLKIEMILYLAQDPGDEGVGGIQAALSAAADEDNDDELPEQIIEWIENSFWRDETLFIPVEFFAHFLNMVFMAPDLTIVPAESGPEQIGGVWSHALAFQPSEDAEPEAYLEAVLRFSQAGDGWQIQGFEFDFTPGLQDMFEDEPV